MQTMVSATDWLLEHVFVRATGIIILLCLLAVLAWVLRRRPKTALVIVYNVVISLAILDVFLVLPFVKPALLPLIPRAFVWEYRENYMNYWRDSYSGSYDPAVTMVIGKDKREFRNPEFDTTLQGNSAGLRDDEASLSAPIVVLGDSHAMGWGVEQEDTFAQRIEQATGTGVLNAGVNSYATVREMIVYGRIQRPSQRYLIIQHCDNDVDENRTFAELGHLPITPEADRAAQLQAAESEHSYRPGKLAVITLFRMVRDMKRSFQRHILHTVPLTPTTVDTGKEVDDFLTALVHAGPPLPDNLHIIVLEINGFNENDSDFLTALAAKAKDSSLPLAVRNLRTIDVSRVLTDKDYFILDDHMNPEGHKKVAEQVAKMIASDK